MPVKTTAVQKEDKMKKAEIREIEREEDEWWWTCQERRRREEEAKEAEKAVWWECERGLE